MRMIWLFLAWRCGWFRSPSLYQWPLWWPCARVQYGDGGKSRCMPLGNAVEYAKMFDGAVVRCVR